MMRRLAAVIGGRTTTVESGRSGWRSTAFAWLKSSIGELAVVGTHATHPHPAEGQLGHGEVGERDVDADRPGRGVTHETSPGAGSEVKT